MKTRKRLRQNKGNAKVGTGARLGQHFLKNAHYAKVLADAAHISAGDTVVEVGPGTGMLTRELLATGARVIAIEKDTALVEQLHETLANEIADKKLIIVSDDIRNVSTETLQPHGGTYAVAANIPYYITGEIIRQFLTATQQPRTMALLVQKEVAERVVARDNKESILSLSVKAYGTPKIVAKVSRGNFSPPPSVDSAILVIENISRNFFSDFSEEHFFHLVRTGFASKRKFLASNLSVIFDKEKVLEAFAKLGIDEKIRAEDVELETWRKLVPLL